MNPLESPRFRQLVLVGSLGGIALLTGVRIAGYEPSPWGWVAGVAVVTALLFGPVAWLVRDNLPEKRRERLAYVAAGLGLLSAPLLLGLGLVTGGLLLWLDTVVLGGIVGLAIATLIERTVVPKRLHGVAHR